MYPNKNSENEKDSDNENENDNLAINFGERIKQLKSQLHEKDNIIEEQKRKVNTHEKLVEARNKKITEQMLTIRKLEEKIESYSDTLLYKDNKKQEEEMRERKMRNEFVKTLISTYCSVQCRALGSLRQKLTYQANEIRIMANNSDSKTSTEYSKRMIDITKEIKLIEVGNKMDDMLTPMRHREQELRNEFAGKRDSLEYKLSLSTPVRHKGILNDLEELKSSGPRLSKLSINEETPNREKQKETLERELEYLYAEHITELNPEMVSKANRLLDIVDKIDLLLDRLNILKRSLNETNVHSSAMEDIITQVLSDDFLKFNQELSNVFQEACESLSMNKQDDEDEDEDNSNPELTLALQHIEEMEEQIDTLNAEITDISKERDVFEEKFHSSQKQYFEMQSEYDQLQEELDIERETQAKLEEAASTLHLENMNLNQTIRIKNNEISGIKDELEDKKSEIENLLLDLNVKRDTIKTLEESITSFKLENVYYQEEIKKMTDRLSEHKKTGENDVNLLNKRILALENIERDYNLLKSEYNLLENDHDVLFNKMTEIQSEQTKIDKLMEEIHKIPDPNLLEIDVPSTATQVPLSPSLAILLSPIKSPIEPSPARYFDVASDDQLASLRNENLHLQSEFNRLNHHIHRLLNKLGFSIDSKDVDDFLETNLNNISSVQDLQTLVNDLQLQLDFQMSTPQHQ
eukprot:TRINITY_DN3188_c1_g1_i1.p1 TRINITY_DN3188_c1_g1~~TRINITY_DN3188_c1_g1_i1.p1  ORF type:complete len:693 (+),score=178.91 TRINITY_DN3188_c1_g1_i1:45-2123(+)